jgi:hypothetical protein
MAFLWFGRKTNTADSQEAAVARQVVVPKCHTMVENGTGRTLRVYLTDIRSERILHDLPFICIDKMPIPVILDRAPCSGNLYVQVVAVPSSHSFKWIATPQNRGGGVIAIMITAADLNQKNRLA